MKEKKISKEALNWRVKDFPEVAVSLTTTLENDVGSWKNVQPVIEDKAAPCTKACPINTLIPQYIDRILEGDLEGAGWILLEHNALPSITGRVCPHFCEIACNRKRYDEAISIRALERFVGDYMLEKKGIPPKEETGKVIAIVGSGPAGMTAAYYLRKKGHKVVIFEKESEGGGVLRYGIPEFRLPKEIVRKEILALEKMGVEFRYNTEVGKDIGIEELLERYDAVFVAHGAGLTREMGIEGEEYLMHGLEFLKQVNTGKREFPGRKYAVIGGGNVAMDVVRTLLRLGKEPILLYRRTRKEMPALPEEVEKAIEDGIEFMYLTQPIKARKVNGQIELTCVKMKLGEKDKSGRPRPIPIEGSEFTMLFDGVVEAIGEYVDTSIMPREALDESGWIYADKRTGETKIKGLFAGGDAVVGPSTVVEAMAWARKAVQAIDAYVMGKELVIEKPAKTVSYKFIMTEYFPHVPRVKERELPVEERIKYYDREENLGLDYESLVKEAERCFSCGHCNRCGNCYVFCPDYAIKWVNGEPKVDYSACKGCGICAQECPRGIITMVQVRQF